VGGEGEVRAVVRARVRFEQECVIKELRAAARPKITVLIADPVGTGTSPLL